MGEFAPPPQEDIWQNRIEFWQKKLLTPPKKCPKNAYARGNGPLADVSGSAGVTARKLANTIISDKSK